MGTLEKKVLGIPRGKVGNIITKINKSGKSIIYPAPLIYKKTKYIEAIKNRKRFACIVKFSSAVNQSPYLKPLWDVSHKRGNSSYTKIYIDNFIYAHHNYMDTNAHITPDGKPLDIIDLDFVNNCIVLDFKVDHSLTDSFLPPYVAVAMIHLYDPVILKAKKPGNYHKFITVEEEFTSYNFSAGKSNLLRFKPSDIVLKEIDNYHNAVVYFTIICRNNKEGNTDCTKSCGTFVKGIDNYFIACDETQNMIEEKKILSSLPLEPVFNIRIK